MLSLAVCSAAPARPYLYTAVDTPSENWTGKDINDYGEVVGSYFLTSVYEGLYFDGTKISIHLGGDHYSWSSLSGMNNHHFGVGQKMRDAHSDPSFAVRAVIVFADPSLIPERTLGSLTGPDGDSNALAINDSNVAVGESKTASGATHAVRFELNGSVTDLGTLGGTNSSAADINNQGEIVGKAQNTRGDWRAFLIPAGGSIHDLGTLGGAESEAVRINNRGEIIGSARAADGAKHAFLYSDGTMQDLGTLFETSSEALGLNDHGVVVGTSGRAFIKFPGQPMADLTKLVFVRYDENLFAATAINNSGVILGVFNGGATYTRLLKPGHLSAELNRGHLEINFSAPAGTTFRLERSGFLGNWTPVATNTLSSTSADYSFEINSDSALFVRAVAGPQ